MGGARKDFGRLVAAVSLSLVNQAKQTRTAGLR